MKSLRRHQQDWEALGRVDPLWSVLTTKSRRHGRWDPAEFFAKATTYWSYFNLIRKNRGKEWQSPLEILLKQAPAMAGSSLLMAAP